LVTVIYRVKPEKLGFCGQLYVMDGLLSAVCPHRGCRATALV
jgi:hypothetical protein